MLNTEIGVGTAVCKQESVCLFIHRWAEIEIKDEWGKLNALIDLM